MLEVVQDFRQAIDANGAEPQDVSPLAPETRNRVSEPALRPVIDAETRESSLRYVEPSTTKFVLMSGMTGRKRFARWLD